MTEATNKHDTNSVNAKTTYIVHRRFFVKKSRQRKYACKVCTETVTEMERQRSTH